MLFVNRRREARPFEPGPTADTQQMPRCALRPPREGDTLLSTAGPVDRTAFQGEHWGQGHVVAADSDALGSGTRNNRPRHPRFENAFLREIQFERCW